ncbi:Autophagy-related protein 16 [Halotydeus destructor]|nr:Autophagy-related protein 16 [Halotydeus destructor]
MAVSNGPSKGYSSKSWRKSIAHQLNARKKREQQPFEDIFNYCSKMFENMDALRSENLHLTIQKEKLQREGFMPSSPGVNSSGQATDERCAQLEKKLFQLQEELTEMHRRKGENAQQIVELKNALEQKENDRRSMASKLSDSEMSVQEYRLACKALEQQILDMESQQQTLIDEHQALQIAFSSLEKRYMEKDKEYSSVVERWIALKARDADI